VLFQRGSFIMRLVREEIPVTHGRKVIGTRLAQVRLHHMRERFSRTADFQKYDKRSSTWESVNCPKEVAEAYLDREGEWQLPILTRVVNAPTLRPDGSVLERPGYDAATGLLFEPQDIAFPSVPTTPDLIDDVIPAVNLLAGLLRDFPFVDEASRAVALSAILTSLIRPSLRSAPLHAFAAPTAGSGKSLLVDIASMISAGHETPVMAQGRTAEEFEKRLNAAFIAGDATIAIDNCEQALGGEFLCQVLTQVSVTIRLLGQTKNNVVPTNACLFATGNNLRIIGDLTRRTIVCSLDPQCERPELRNFPADPLELIRQNRALYVAAGLTMLRWARLAELPKWSTPTPLASFEEWSRWIRNAIIFFTGADPCATMERARAQDPELEMLGSVAHQWDSVIGGRRVSVSDVIEIATKYNSAPEADGKKFVNEALREALLVVAGNIGNIDSRRLGTWLGRNKDRIVKGKKIVPDGILNGITQWRLVHIPDTSTGSEEEAGSNPEMPFRFAA
jgi:putative DNA primase/helicase